MVIIYPNTNGDIGTQVPDEMASMLFVFETLLINETSGN